MAINSIKDNLTKEFIISDIKLCIGADIKKEKIYLLVEGEDDIKFLKTFLSDNVYISESYSGKSGVECIVDEVFPDDNRIIGICDRDYSIENHSYKIFYYDYNCMEMMILSNDHVFQKLCAEYYKGKTPVKQLRINLLKKLKYLSIIRMCNERNGWRKNFKAVNLNTVWDKIEKELNNNEIINKINNSSTIGFNNTELQQIEQEYEKEWNEEEYFFYTQGHDFTTLYALICSQHNKNKGPRYDEIESSLRVGFSENDFMRTKLYDELIKYEHKNKVVICNKMTS